MKKLLILLVSLFTTSTVMAFNIDIDKIDVNSLGKGLANNLDSSYRIETESFDKKIDNDEDAVELVKRMVNLATSNIDLDSKKKEYTEYMYFDQTDGAKTLAGTLFRDAYFEELKQYKITGG